MRAQSPPLGWKSWNSFGANISQDQGVFELESNPRVDTHSAVGLRIRPVKIG